MEHSKKHNNLRETVRDNVREYVRDEYLTAKTNALLNQGKQFANKVYHDSVDKIYETEEEVILKIKKHPLRSVFIAAGIGFLVSLLIRLK